MLNPVRSSLSWIAGRLLLLLIIVVGLVAADAFRAESSIVKAQIKSLLPEEDFLERLKKDRAELEADARAGTTQANARLRAASASVGTRVERRIAELQGEISAKEMTRRNATQRTLALLTGDGFRQDFELEIDIQLLRKEQDILRTMQRGIDFRQQTVSDAKEAYDLVKKRQIGAQSRVREKEVQAAKYAKDNFWLDRFPKSLDAEEGWEVILADLKRLRAAKKEADKSVELADKALAKAKAISRTQTAMITGVSTTVLEPLDQLIADKSKVIDAARDMTDRVMRSVRRVFLLALWILIAVTVAPVFVSAFWFVCIAPLAAGRSTICLWPSAAGGANAGVLADGVSSQRALISGVSKEVALNDQNELLVHPGFLQSAAERSRKSTKWLLTWRFPLASVAAGMVGLIRIRCSTPERFVISSKSDPLVEIGLVDIQDGEALVLQPRALVGVIQRQDRPIAITRKWNFTLAALITLQFRYMIFSGPGTLIVQGCRGVRAEKAGDGRSIDQQATIGFSANLQYSAKRSETFGAYLMGMRGLFNDHFSGAPGYYLYEEMPYLAKKSGITGRGLEGLTDALMKAFGI